MLTQSETKMAFFFGCNGDVFGLQKYGLTTKFY